MKKAVFDLKSIAVLSAAVLVLTACGGSPPVSIADLPTFAGATALQPGASTIATTLKNNETQAAAMGQKIEQKAFQLPKGTAWDAVKGFYTEQLKALGRWALLGELSLGGELRPVPGLLPMVRIR